MQYFKKSVAIKEATDCMKRFGGTWHVISILWGKFDIVKDSNLRSSEKEDIVETIQDTTIY